MDDLVKELELLEQTTRERFLEFAIVARPKKATLFYDFYRIYFPDCLPLILRNLRVGPIVVQGYLDGYVTDLGYLTIVYPFLPELEATRPGPWFDMMMAKFKVDPSLRANDWQLFREQRMKLPPIVQVMMDDDDDALRVMMGGPNYNPAAFVENMNHLGLAAHYGAIKCFRLLMINHAPEVIVYMNKMPSFYHACYSGNEEIIQLLEENEDQSLWYGVLGAIEGCRNNVLEWLINVRGAKLYPKAFESASRAGNFGALLLLIKTNTQPSNCLVQAPRLGIDWVRFFLEAGVDVEQSDDYGNTAMSMHMISLSTENDRIRELLLSWGAKENTYHPEMMPAMRFKKRCLI